MPTHNVITTGPPIDFSHGERGKFFRKDARLPLPLYLDDPLQERPAALVRELLPMDRELIEAMH